MITFNDLSFKYKDKTILNNLKVHLPEGSFHFLTGPSGSGKSTLLKICSFDLVPTSGDAEVMGLNPGYISRDDIAAVRRKIGVINQNCLFVDHLSLYDNVILPVIAAGLDPANEHKNVIELLDWVGLGDRLSARPAELSGGEQQRAALARAIIMSPDLILADEPTGNVDWEMGQKLLTLLVQLNSMGKTVLIATHDLNLIRTAKGKVATRILRLADGTIDIAGTNL